MTVELIEGEIYTVKATTTNMSTKAGVPVAATLAVNITAVVDSQTILDNSAVYGFAAGETQTFEFTMAVPMGAGGKAGAVAADVLDPDGNKLADGSLDISIAAVGPPSGEILEITWKRYYGTDVWHPISAPIPEKTEVYHRWRVKNTGSGAFYFNIGQYKTGYGEGWYYTNHPIQLGPNEEGYVEDVFSSGYAKPPFSFTWYLFGNDVPLTGYQGKEYREYCDSMTVTIRVV